MRFLVAAIGLAALLAVGAVLSSGGSQADSVRHRYLPGSNELRTVARFGTARKVTIRPLGRPDVVRAAPRWLAAAEPLGPGAPGWVRRMYLRSLLVLHSLIDPRTGAVLAGARRGWSYVWPRDASAAAMALADAGYLGEARRIVRFLQELNLGAAARFHRNGIPVDGRDAQGDAGGWIAAAAGAAGIGNAVPRPPWRGLDDYQENGGGDFLANAIASGAAHIRGLFATASGALARRAGDPRSGLDSAAAWAVRPFPQPALYPLVRRTLLRLAARSGRFGIVPSEGWDGGEDPWTAPTAWTAWSLAALGERRASLHLMSELRRAATSRGVLPERVDAQTGVPTSTTPLVWSHAFAILALRELWPGSAQPGRRQRQSQ
jgi:hypothetical protein